MVLDDIVDFLEKRTGIVLEYNFKNILFEIVNERLTMLETDIDGYYNILKNNINEEFDNVVDQLTIKDTYFFKDCDLYENLRIHILPRLLNRYDNLRIWSIGCSSGEEPYSIAMIIDMFYPEYKDRITIRASDISHNIVKDALAGIYNKFSFREESPIKNYKSLYFLYKDNLYHLKSYIKKMVTFDTFNIIDLKKYTEEDFHIIICKNVLMYMDAKHVNDTIKIICNMLVDEGYFISGLADPVCRMGKSFKTIFSENGFLHIKQNLIEENEIENIYGKIISKSKIKLDEKHKLSININDIVYNYEKEEYGTVLNMIKNTYKVSDEKNRKLMILVLVLSMFEIGKGDISFEILKNNMNNFSDNQYIWLMFIYGYLKNESNEKNFAIQIFNNLLNERKNFIPALYELANIYYDMGDYSRSKELFISIIDSIKNYKENKLFIRMIPGIKKNIIDYVVRSRSNYLQQLIG